MEKINKSIKTLLWISLALSVGFPLGILGIVFGAVNKIVFLLILGIVFTVAGFYVMPIMWVKYGEKRRYKTVLYMILNEHLYTVSDLSTQTGMDENTVREMIKTMIMSHYLVGFLFVDDTLILNTNQKQSAKATSLKKCPNCGGPMAYDGVKFFCEYCGTTSTEK